MNLFITSIISIIGILSVVNSQQLFANFIPYPTEDCSGSSLGLGFTLAVSKCIFGVSAFQEVTDYMWNVEVEEESNWITVGQFELSHFTCNGNAIHYYNIKNGTCTDTPNFTKLNGTITGMGDQWYSFVTITSKPQYASNSQVHEIYNQTAMGNCNYENYENAVTFTNGLEIITEITDQIDTWTCPNNDPINVFCDLQGRYCQTVNEQAACDPNNNYGNENAFCTN
ncbi:hypothetical protein DLAC_10354 [Tieghemostelium lacteum]|uniref:Uncharacterized protein n=1 Tax=Tieghemostelium lacteum TaxID=361077 RepID=A0A151Z5A5_TIELA|nr:hypothetical protein DLAC_10354 [Tieghemostelium lacteum]|eukprot:KYQ89118.1 hypothetical protein DLAC_10354 [Tieghemostelium lacteum]